MSYFQINAAQWRQLSSNYRQNRSLQQSFLVEKVNKYFPTSVWTNWDKVIRDPVILNKISKASDFEEVYEILKANSISGISDKSILHTALHLLYKYNLPFDDCCWCGFMRMANMRCIVLYIQQLGGLNNFHKQCETFAETSDLELMCMIVLQSGKISKLLRTGRL